MSVMLDAKVAFVLNLIGFNWPAADEDKLRQSAHHWREYATELEHAIADTNRILLQVRAENSAESIDALEQHGREFGQHLHQAHDAAGTVAQVLDEFALVVEGLKLKVAAQLLLLAGELTATTGAAFLTFGLAEAAAPEEIIVTQGFMRWVTNVAIQKVERLVADKVAKKVVEHFLSIKNGLKALKALPTTLKKFGKAVEHPTEKFPTGPSYRELRYAHSKDAHHIIQDAAVRDVEKYDRNKAPAVQLKGPSTTRGTPHFLATQAQRDADVGGTYGAERQVAYDSLIAAGYSSDEAVAAVARADEYFMGELGLTHSSVLRWPGDRQ